MQPLHISATRLAVICLASILLMQLACQKEFSVEDNTVYPPPPSPRLAFITIQGLVMDEEGRPMADAMVFTDNSTTTTDRYGLFRMEKVPMNPNGGLVTVERQGYFEGSRSLLYRDTGTNFIRIRMVRRSLAGVVKSASGGTVSVGAGKILFPESAFKLDDGTDRPYTGDVRVFAAHLPGDRLALLDQMPGNLMGIRSDGGFAGLETLGMMMVELEGSSGEALQLAKGKSATLQIPALSNGPAQVPLWYFDKATGFWKQEGFALKSGSDYVGKVSHFSSWNWDLPYPVVTIKARFMTGAEMPLQNYRIVIKRNQVTDNTKLSVTTVTDSMGVIQGPMPANETVTMSVLDPCGEVILTKTVGPVSTNTDLGVFTVNIPSTAVVEVNGMLTDCSNRPVSSGYFSLLVGDRSYRAGVDANGQFRLKFINCGNLGTATASGFDANAVREGTPVSLTLTPGSQSVGTLNICGTQVQGEFIDYTVNGTGTKLSTPADILEASLVSDTLTVNGRSADGKKFVNMIVKTNGTAGAKPLLSFTSHVIREMNPNGASITLSSIGATGSLIDGNMTANLISYDSLQSGRQVPVLLFFKVKRTR